MTRAVHGPGPFTYTESCVGSRDCKFVVKRMFYAHCLPFSPKAPGGLHTPAVVNDRTSEVLVFNGVQNGSPLAMTLQ